MNDPNAPTPNPQTTVQSLGSQERLAREAGGTAPKRIGRYEIRRLLGEGAYGTVYLAFDPTLNREVALKVPVGLTTPAAREAFLHEARAAAGIHHPNVCQVFDTDTAENVPFIVSRYVEGGTLADVLKRANGPLPPDEALEIVRKIALGLAAAHAKDVVHRDLKPGNVLFDKENNEFLITDFGLAKLLTHAGQSSGGTKGTPAYMSPEQFGDGRKAGDVSPLSDVYSLGVVLYELLTGQLPFKGDNPLAMLWDHTQTTPEPPSARRRDLGTGLDELCLKALAKKPADRHASAKDFAKALAKALAAIRAKRQAEAEAHYQRGNDCFDGSGVRRRAGGGRGGELGEHGNDRIYYSHVLRSYLAACEWYEKAAAMGHEGAAGALYRVLELIWEEEGPEEYDDYDYQNDCKQAAQGDAGAQCRLGWIYFHGETQSRDYAKAREWFELAAAQGDASAQCGLGVMYENGLGVPEDDAKARGWFELAAAQGNARAQSGLGSMYLTGAGGPQDDVKARAWIELAAAQENVDAQFYLGRMYECGRGVPQDFVKARAWYEKAAAQGDADAQFYLGGMYEAGLGVGVDRKRAMKLYREAAKGHYLRAGNEDAKAALKRLGEEK